MSDFSDFIPGLNPDYDRCVLKSEADAKGDILAATADDAISGVTVGTDGQILIADAASANGVKWDDAAAGGITWRDNDATDPDPAAHDFTVGDFTTDGSAHDLDLSGVVPSGTTSVWFKLRLSDGSTGQYIQFRKNGNTNWISAATARTQVANISLDGFLSVPLDSNRKCEYRTSNTTFTAIDFTVTGWSS